MAIIINELVYKVLTSHFLFILYVVQGREIQCKYIEGYSFYYVLCIRDVKCYQVFPRFLKLKSLDENFSQNIFETI